MVPQVRGESWENTNHQNRAVLGVRPRGGPRRGAKAFRKGPWSTSETKMLEHYVSQNGPRNWSNIHKHSMLRRNGKSCRLRWFNHLRSHLRKCPFSLDEERRIIELHYKIGNKWAKIARVLDGRTDNDVKNFWNTRLKKCKREGLPVYPLDIQENGSRPNYSIPIHQSPNFGNPLVPVLNPFSFGSPASPYIPDVSLINPIRNDININNFSNPTFLRTPSDIPYCHQVMPTPHFTNIQFKRNDASFDGVDFSQTEAHSLQEKGKGIGDSRQMEDPNAIDLKLNFKIGDNDIMTKINHLDNSSPDNSSYQTPALEMSAITDSFERMTMTEFDEELAALLDSSIPSPTLDW